MSRRWRGIDSRSLRCRLSIERTKINRHLVGKVAGLAAIFFVALAPTLSWPQFSGDSEDLVVQTVLEMRNGGPWLVPTLGGRPRTRKPPLPAWIAAAAVSPDTIRDLSSTQPAVRESAYRNLAWQVRWPSLLAGCLMLLALGWMAEMIGGPAHVIPAVLCGGTSLLFLRYARTATPDVHLALWVTVANAFLAAAMIRGRRWLGFIGGGAALGLALMSKGPVALVETVLPFAVFGIMRRKCDRTAGLTPQWPPILAGTLVMLAIALPWYVSIVVGQPGILSVWLNELRGEGVKSISHDPWYAYWALLPNLLPWLPMFIAGMYLAIPNLVSRRSRHLRRIALAVLLVLIPVVVLSLFHDRKERYLLPLAAPAAILVAHAVVRLKRAIPLRRPNEKLVWTIHWGILIAMAIGLPLYLFKRLNGTPWFSVPGTFLSISGGVGILIAGKFLQRRLRLSFVTAGAALMLPLYALFMYGWSQSSEGLSEMKPIADRLHADFPGRRIVYYNPTNDKPVTLDLDIYLNRPVAVESNAPPSKAFEGAAAIVVLRNDKDQEPNFAGWRTHFELMSRKHHWYVLTPSGRLSS